MKVKKSTTSKTMMNKVIKTDQFNFSSYKAPVKKIEEPVKADPLEYLPYEVFDKVLSYLPHWYLLAASGVNKNWYERIGQSKYFKKNVKVHLHDIKGDNYEKELIESPRNYDTLEINFNGINDTEDMDVIFEILESRPWTNVIIHNKWFDYVEDAMELFSIIQENVKYLSLEGCYIQYRQQNIEKVAFEFPSLKKFEVKRTTICEMFQNIRTLDHFEILSDNTTPTSFNSVLNILETNDNLQSLTINGHILERVLKVKKLEEMPFKLKTLSVDDVTYQKGEFSTNFYKNLIEFIKYHSDTLETVILDDWMGEDVLKAVYKLPKLKSLTINKFTQLIDDENNFIDHSEIILARNPSIKILDINVKPENFNILKSIISATPNLLILEITYFNQQFMEFIHQKTPKIVKLKATSFSPDFIPQNVTFENLKILEIKFYSKKIQRNIMAKGRQGLNSFERLVRHIVNNEDCYLNY
jgi:hypothetical protein